MTLVHQAARGSPAVVVTLQVINAAGKDIRDQF
jgi:hypothetical protein